MQELVEELVQELVEELAQELVEELVEERVERRLVDLRLKHSPCPKISPTFSLLRRLPLKRIIGNVAPIRKRDAKS